MNNQYNATTVTVSASASLSSVYDNSEGITSGIVIPSALEATTKLAFYVCDIVDGTYVPLYDTSNVLIEITVAVNAARAYPVPEQLKLWPYIKIWTEASGSNVTQTADRVFTFMSLRA